MEKLPRSCNLCVVTYGSDRGRGKFSHLALVFSFFFFSLFVYSFATKRMSIVKTIFLSFDIFFILRFLFVFLCLDNYSRTTKSYYYIPLLTRFFQKI